MDFRIVLLMVYMTTVECVNRAKFQATTPPQKNFSPDQYTGDWYIVARMPSCSWVGSFDFTNFVSQYTLQPDGIMILKDTYRSQACTSNELELTPKGAPGNYEAKDPIGNVISGPQVIVATDYKRFAIKKGCNKPIGDICQDPFIVVKTRKKVPSPHTYKIIEKILDHLYELSLSEMIKVVHDERACIKLPEYHKKHHHPYYPGHVDHLKKMY